MISDVRYARYAICDTNCMIFGVCHAGIRAESREQDENIRRIRMGWEGII